jgi:hypothetical protein
MLFFFNLFSKNNSNPNPITRGKSKSRGRKQTKIPLLSDIDILTPLSTVSSISFLSFEKKGTEQLGKKRKTKSKKIKFNNLNKTYRPLKLFLKDGLTRVSEFNNSESSEDNMLFFQKTRLRRQRRERHFINFSNEGIKINERETF